MKSVILAALVVAGASLAFAAPARAQSLPLPQGSYRNSCNNARAMQLPGGGRLLTAQCRTSNGATRNTSLRFENCRGDIANNNGTLTCSNLGGGVGATEPVVHPPQAAIRSFLQQRSELLSQINPDSQMLHRRLRGSVFGRSADADGQSGSPEGEPFTLNGNLGPDQIRADFSSSMAIARPEANAAFNIWGELHYSNYRSDVRPRIPGEFANRSRGSYLVALGGIDYRVDPSVLVGVLGQYDRIEERRSTAGTDARGHGYLVGPYLSMRLAPRLLFDARAGFGGSSNRISPQGLPRGDFDTSHQLYRAALTGDYALGKVRFTPNLALLYSVDRQHRFSNPLNVVVPGQTISLGQLTFGPEFAYTMKLNSLTLTPRFGIGGIYDFHRDDASALVLGVRQPTGAVRARIEGGVDLDGWYGFGIGTSLGYDGIGAEGYHVIIGRIAISKRF